jgi:SAM-dependent methyltransferase
MIAHPALWALVVGLTFAVPARAADPLDAQGRAMLDPLREESLRPAELVSRLQVRPDAIIADVGAGPGFLTLPLARAVPRGYVLALDIRPDYLIVAAERAAAAGLKNIKTRLTVAHRPQVEPRSVDLVVLCQVDHYLADRVSYFSALLAALRPGGRIVLINYIRYRESDIGAVKALGLKVLDEWRPSAGFFVLVIGPTGK